LGIKAVVSAIYEPPQKSFVDGIELLEEEFKKEIVVVDEIAAEFGLERIGMIYTDLTDDGTGTGKVICRRHVESFFVSSVESVFMALEQLEHKNKTKYSSSGEYGSKFATVIISGDTDGNIHLSAYQVSVTCMSLVRDGIVDASVDPHLMLVRESTPTHYVPEVFFKYKDKYGVTVQEAAKPTFPVDYFIVTVTEGFPHLVNPFFKASNFPIENRGGLSIHNMNTLADHLDKFQHQAFSDFHFLLYLKKIVTKPVWDEIVYSVVKNRPVSEGVVQYFKDLVAASKAETKSSTAAANTSTTWTCSHCTFINSKSGDCDMCGLPRE
jgi:nuclear protein localization family protein 4